MKKIIEGYEVEIEKDKDGYQKWKVKIGNAQYGNMLKGDAELDAQKQIQSIKEANL